MKKTLSILLSLLMVLGTITCLFTAPVTTASAEEAATPAVETLPVNDFITNNAVKTITPDSVVTIGGVEFPTSVNYGIRGWNQKKDDAGNVISGQDDSYIDNNVYYQMTFDVTVSDDINDGVTFRPVFHSNASMNQGFAGIVGMRTDVTAPATVETAYNLKTNANSTAADLPSTTAENAATLVAGKTYTYTYVFNSYSRYINNIRMLAEGLTAGSVTVGEVKIFPRSETFANNFQFTTTVVSYDVEENGNVFTRLYGYRDVGSTSAGHKTLSAKLGGDLYNMTIQGGKTYELRFDARFTSKYGFNDSDSTGRAPAFDLYETGAFDYTNDYASIKDAADDKNYNIAADNTASQRTYSGPNNGYSYFYAGSGTSTYNRRIKNNIATMSYYDAAGALLTSKSQGYGSQSGRNLKNEINTSTWIKGVYSLDAIGAQTVQEAAVAGSTSDYDAHMRYRYANGAWTFNSALKNLYAPAKQDVTVALSIDFIQLGSVYDFDNFELVSDVKDVPVEYIDANGNAVTTAYTSHSASSYYDATAGKTYATIKLFENDAYTFNGWYNGDEFISTDAELVLDGNYNNLKVVITTKNLLTNAGGFENYSNGTVLEAAYTELNTTNYPNYTGTASDQRRFYNARPTGDKWTGWDNNGAKLGNITDSDGGVTKAKIIADIEAAGGVINDSGFTGFTWFKNFPQVVSAKDVTVYSDAGNYSGNSSKVYVMPYSGTKMLQMQASSRSAYRAIEGLTPGKTYTLSFYAYNTYAYYFLKDVAVKTAPNNAVNNHADSKQLAVYTTPYDTVDETYLNDKGTETSGSIQKAKADYVGKWYNISLTFTAEDTVAYLALTNQNKAFTGGFTYIDELTLVEYDCEGSHLYDDLLDIDCNVCGETRVYDTDWDFEDESLENIVNGTGTIEVVDAVDQPEKIGDKYLQYNSKGWSGVTFNFPYEQGYKYKISYDFKIFAYGTGANANGIDIVLLKDADGKYGPVDGSTQTADALNPATDNIVTRYFEDGTVYEKVACFTHATSTQNNFYGRKSVDGVYVDEISPIFGPAEMWNEWQHFEIEVGTNNDYNGMVEYSIRPNDAGWVVGIDNFKVEKVATAAIDEADDATNGTYAFNIRARSAEKKQGLRFKSTIDLDKLNLADGAKIVEYGTLATKASNLDQAYLLRREAADAANAKVIAGVAYNAEDGTDIRYAIDETTNTLTYTGVLTGIGVKNYDVDFAVCGYAIVEYADGARITVYDDMATLSVYDAAQQIVDANANAADVAIAQTVIDTYDAYVAAN